MCSCSVSVVQLKMEAAQSQSESAGVDAVLDRKLKNTLPLYGNRESMNLNSMILTNIQGSPYFKEDLYQYKTFHEVVDEIFYKVGWWVKSTVLFFFLSGSLLPVFVTHRWNTWSPGRRTVVSWLDKLACVEG